MVTQRPPVPGWHPARTRGVLGIIALVSFLAAAALLLLAPGMAVPSFAIAFAASAVVAGADSRDAGRRP